MVLRRLLAGNRARQGGGEGGEGVGVGVGVGRGGALVIGCLL